MASGALRVVLLAAVLGLTACQPESAPAPVLRDFRLLELRADACAGRCPEYTLTLDEHGQLRFEGHRHTAVPKAAKQLSEADFEALKLKLDALIDKDWPIRFDARNCPSFSNGQSSLVWRLEMRGKRLDVSQSLGCMGAPDANGAQDYYPPEWNQLYRELASLSELATWVSGK